MSVNKIILAVAIIFAIFLAFIFIQFNPFGKAKNIPTVTVKNQKFTVTIADTEEARQQGLSGQDSLPMKEGKLFLFDNPDRYAFWMKGMKFPIDIIFIHDNKIASIVENAPPATSDNSPIYQPPSEVDTALEINGGLSKKYNLKPGDSVAVVLPTPSPSPKP